MHGNFYTHIFVHTNECAPAAIISTYSNCISHVINCYFFTPIYLFIYLINYRLLLLLYCLGTAFIPFDPNDLPVAKDNKAWWKVLQDFFNNEL